MGKSLLIFLLITITLSSQAPTQIDVVHNLLKDLKDNSKNELDLLDSSWAENSAKKNAAILALSQSLSQQRGVCSNRDQDVSNKERDITITNNFIAWLDKRIKENNNRLAVLDNNRCDSNTNYINHIRNNKMILNIIRFLRNALIKANENDLPALIQTNEFQQHLKFFLQLTNDESTLKQFQLDENLLEKKRTLNKEEMEIKTESQGFAHLLSQDSQTFSRAKQELLDLLDSMEQEVQNQIAISQDLQVKSAMGLNDFKGLIHQENDTFEHYLLQENENLKKLMNQLTSAVQAAEQCKARLQQMIQAVQFVTDDYASAEANYKSIRERLISEADLFDDVSRIYSNQVNSQSTDYKKGIDQKIRK